MVIKYTMLSIMCVSRKEFYGNAVTAMECQPMDFRSTFIRKYEIVCTKVICK